MSEAAQPSQKPASAPTAARKPKTLQPSGPAAGAMPTKQELPEGFRVLKVGVVLRIPDEVTQGQEDEYYRPGFWQDAIERMIGETGDARERIHVVDSAPLFRTFQKPPAMDPPPAALSEYHEGGFLPGQAKLVEAWKAWAAKYPGSPEAAQFRERLARAER